MWFGRDFEISRGWVYLDKFVLKSKRVIEGDCEG